jgi:hypothetical protein
VPKDAAELQESELLERAFCVLNGKAENRAEFEDERIGGNRQARNSSYSELCIPGAAQRDTY